MSHYAAPTTARLLERLQQLGAVEKGVTQLTAEEAAHAINQFLCDQAVCSRAVVDGKERVLTFANYWAALYGKWKYVRHNERGLLEKCPI